MKMTNRTHKKAFTLVDVLISIVIMGVIINLVFLMMTKSFKLNYDTHQEINGRYNSLIILTSLRDDVHNADKIGVSNTQLLLIKNNKATIYEIKNDFLYQNGIAVLPVDGTKSLFAQGRNLDYSLSNNKIEVKLKLRTTETSKVLDSDNLYTITVTSECGHIEDLSSLPAIDLNANAENNQGQDSAEGGN